MTRRRIFAGLGFVVLGLGIQASSTCADEAAAPAADPAPTSDEAFSLQGFGGKNPLCREWSDGCSICLRDEKDSPRCSTPGIACQPVAIVCAQAKAQ
jgi:hypothetical protein